MVFDVITLRPTAGEVKSVTLKQVTTGWDEDEPLAGDETGQSVLGGLHEIVDVDVNVIIVFDVIYCGLCWNLVDDQSCPLQTVICNILHLFTHKALWLLTRLPVCWQQVFVLWTTDG